MFDQFSPYQGNPAYSTPMWPNQYSSAQQRLAQLQQMQAPVIQPQNLVRVTGMEGARAYQMAPNSVAALFDANNDIFFVKSTDDAGFPTIRTFRFTPIENEDPKGDYITRDEFDKLKEAVLSVQQSVWKQPTAAHEQPHGHGTEVQPVPATDVR